MLHFISRWRKDITKIITNISLTCSFNVLSHTLQCFYPITSRARRQAAPLKLKVANTVPLTALFIHEVTCCRHVHGRKICCRLHIAAMWHAPHRHATHRHLGHSHASDMYAACMPHGCDVQHPTHFVPYVCNRCAAWMNKGCKWNRSSFKCRPAAALNFL